MSPDFSFLIYKLGVVIIPYRADVRIKYELYPVQWLAYGNGSVIQVAAISMVVVIIFTVIV